LHIQFKEVGKRQFDKPEHVEDAFGGKKEDDAFYGVIQKIDEHDQQNKETQQEELKIRLPNQKHYSGHS
jgi:hypothetical protein